MRGQVGAVEEEEAEVRVRTRIAIRSISVDFFSQAILVMAEVVVRIYTHRS